MSIQAESLPKSPRFLSEDKEYKKKYVEKLKEEIAKLYKLAKELYEIGEPKVKLQIIPSEDRLTRGTNSRIYFYHEDEKEMISSFFGLFYLYGFMHLLVDIKERREIRVDTYAKELRDSLISLATKAGYAIDYNVKKRLTNNLYKMLEKVSKKLPFIRVVEEKTISMCCSMKKISYPWK
ncbi:MAG: hypothetical protein J7K98_04165 [Candidatus Aenigmarchaeota archaeon]|nr:hypothetical protein [Candidatus Aenigmarchaeota archaeon]